MSKKKKIVFLILIAFSNLIAFQNQFIICKESNGKIFIESSLNKCCDKNETICCFGNRNFKLEYSISKQADNCSDTQLEIPVFNKQNLVKVTVEHSSSFNVDSNLLTNNNSVVELPITTDNSNAQSQKFISSIVLLI
ncbi:MAG: hypothetical protein AB1521_10525 [Bacteroidota bacterium]